MPHYKKKDSGLNTHKNNLILFFNIKGQRNSVCSALEAELYWSNIITLSFQYSRNWKIGRFISAIVVFAFLYNLPKFWELKVKLLYSFDSDPTPVI